jgi:hypothetical protein
MMKAQVTERLTERLQDNPPRRGNRVLNRFDGEILALAETYTGLTADEIATELRGGTTLADLITANNGDVDAFIAEAVAIGEARIDERATQRKENLPEIVASLVNGEQTCYPLRLTASNLNTHRPIRKWGGGYGRKTRFDIDISA